MEGSYGEMVWGLMLGFFMGLIVLFWFKEATFSRRQQMGKLYEGLEVTLQRLLYFFLLWTERLTKDACICPPSSCWIGIIAGMMINVGFGVLHLYY